MSASTTQATLTPGGLAVAPIDAPAAVQEVIAAGNEIARLPYRYGGGHMTYEDSAYDCSGSISYVFAAAHLLDHTVVSGDLENWGKPGPGKWITVFANAGHTFMYVAGLRFDTVALAETGSRWSNRSADESDLNTFAVRHPAGLRIKSVGAAGPFEMILTRLDRVEIADSRIDHPATRFPSIRGEGLPFTDVDGSIGYEILKHS